METLGALAKKTLVQFKDQVAVRDAKGSITYDELRKEACKLADSLQSDGLNKGDRVGLLMSNRREHIIFDIALAMTGLIKVPINYRLHAREINYIIEDSQCEIVFGEADYIKNIDSPIKRVDIDTDYQNYIAYGEDQYPVTKVYEDDLFALMYTSGTTGKPKGGMLTHRNMISSALSLNMVCEMNHNDVIGHVAPLTHGSNFLSQCALFFGLKQVIFDSFDPKEFIDDLERERISVIFLVPTLVNLMIQDQHFDPHKLRYMKSINMAGAPIAVDKLKQALQLVGPIFAETYGLVEAPMTISIMPKGKLESHPDSCGVIGPFVEVKIVDENGEEVQNGEIGEVACKGSLVMKGYWNNEEATKESFRDGWFLTGDLGSLDDTGYLRLVDRAKDTIITGGLNVYPREVEEILNLHPSVKETSVFGIPDEKWGESICAHVVLNDHHETITDDELIALCKQHLASYKKPRLIKIVDGLPKNSYGKILRKELRNQYQLQGGK